MKGGDRMIPQYQMFVNACQDGYVDEQLFKRLCEGALQNPINPEALGELEPVMLPIQLRPVLQLLQDTLLGLGKCEILSLAQFLAILREHGDVDSRAA